jgi:hypothetical protein
MAGLDPATLRQRHEVRGSSPRMTVDFYDGGFL